MVLADALKLAVVGIAVGVGAAVAATRLLQGLLFGVSPLDPTTFISVVTLLVSTAVAATLAPARRAAAANPMTALRRE